MNSLFCQLKYEFRKVFRDKTLLMLTYLMPIGFYLMMGFFMIEINPSFLEIMIPSMSIFTILTSTLMSIPNSIVDDRKSGVLKSYIINGITKYQYLIVNTVSAIIHVLIVNTIIMISANIIFNAPMPESLIAFYLLNIIGCITFTGISSLIGSIAKSNKSTILIAQLIYLPSMMLSGIMVPKEMMPKKIIQISNVIPTTQLMNAMRKIAYNKTITVDNFHSIYILIGILVISYIISLNRFSYDNNK